jgi:prepilin-type N-terminal cleavage/methylation domain-containing protein
MSRRPRSGFTLVELMLVMTILAVALVAMGDTVLTVNRLGPVNEEGARALEAGRGMVETLRGTTFAEVYARYNDDPADDPDGPNTAPGKHFVVPRLSPRQDDPDGFVGEILLPGTTATLREDVDDVDLGLPRDLNGDGLVDVLDHATDYGILPVIVRLEWSGTSGPRRLDLPTALVRP